MTKEYCKNLYKSWDRTFSEMYSIILKKWVLAIYCTHCCRILFGVLTQLCDKKTTIIQHKAILIMSKIFDYTTVENRCRTDSWNVRSHPAIVVSRFTVSHIHTFRVIKKTHLINGHVETKDKQSLQSKRA